jgi:DNA-binding MarR family transcriptional regulator
MTRQRLKIWKDVDPHLELDGVDVLLAVAQEEGRSVKEITRTVGLTGASGSRWLLYWGTGSWSSGTKRRQGLGYLEARPDPMDSRVKRIYLTDTGRLFINNLLNQEQKFQQRLADGNKAAQEWNISGRRNGTGAEDS